MDTSKFSMTHLIFARVDEKILICQFFLFLLMSLIMKLGMSFSFVMENLSCEFALVNR